MPLETATTIAGLNALWPLGSDSKGEGDDHIRLIKSVLQTDPTISSGLVAQSRNRLCNGAMQISQELGNVVTTFQAYAADQWSVVNGTTATGTCQQVQVVTPNGSRDRYRVSITGADAAIAAAEYVVFQQRVEGIRIADFRWGTASAKQVVLRFGIKAPAGTYSVVIRNAPSNRSWIANFTVSAGEANTDLEKTFVIPGDTAGVWTTDTTAGLIVGIGLAVGTTFQGIAGWQSGDIRGTATNTNGVATIGPVFEFFDFGLYYDPAATGKAPAWQMPDEAAELAACQRYWQRLYLLFSGNATAASSYAGSSAYKAFMRVSPTAVGTHQAAVGFPATAGTFNSGAYNQGAANNITEARTCNATGPSSFTTIWELSARM